MYQYSGKYPWPKTSPNQKVAVIKKEKLTENYLSIHNPTWQAAFRDLTGATFGVYLQLMANADEFPFAIGSKQGIKQLGISERTFQKAINILIEKGYLVQVGGNVYEAYETPQLKPEKTSGLKENQTGKNIMFNPEENVSQTGKKFRFNPEENYGDIDKKDNTNKIDSILSAEEEARKKLEAKGFTSEEVEVLIAGKPQSVWNEKGYGLCFTAAYQKEKLAAVKAKVIAFEAAKELHHAQNATMYEPTATTWVEEEPVRIIKKRGM